MMKLWIYSMPIPLEYPYDETMDLFYAYSIPLYSNLHKNFIINTLLTK